MGYRSKCRMHEVMQRDSLNPLGKQALKYDENQGRIAASYEVRNVDLDTFEPAC